MIKHPAQSLSKFLKIFTSFFNENMLSIWRHLAESGNNFTIHLLCKREADFLDFISTVFIDRDVVHSIMEQLMINCNGQDTEVRVQGQIWSFKVKYCFQSQMFFFPLEKKK